MKVVKLALIGCGKAATRHQRLFREMPEAKVVAVSDLDPAKARAFAEALSAEPFTDWREMLARHPEVEVVDIAVPSGLHARVALSVMREFRKHVLLEKPIALLLDEAQEMVETARSLGLKLVTVYQNRFNLPVKLVREALQGGHFGKPVLFSARFYWCRRQDYYDSAAWRGTWALDGGALAQQGAHHVDMLRWLGGEVESVYAEMATRLNRLEAEDLLVGTIRFRNGALGTIEATTCARPRDLGAELVVLGEKGSARLGGFAMNELLHLEFEDGFPPPELLEAHRRNPEDPLGFAHRECLRAALRYFAGEGPDPRLCLGEEAVASLELIQALYESAERGEPVRFPFRPEKSRLGRG
ncbi:Gfo/Idh/MocA family oxidoreductase [Thermosulfurimonas marina]|uniref:Gfo/Idh/MocA family oxidoreductase n=1 Tax=Thermosulfurimonas marina TaxID=2047767 RepID=A0A6H1WSS5_9BACT|nr:Gfo/Idh/MocA family oxidoreductase [Thermosulfurimonas marina]QJA06275.1 Gfo/Idh/MocA family oxidoreductase [Thermosulfurimonas marina]